MMSKDTVMIDGVEHDLYPVNLITELEALVHDFTKEQGAYLATEIKLLERLEAVKPYLRHSDLCVTKEAETHELHMESRCTCGLRKALEAGK